MAGEGGGAAANGGLARIAETRRPKAGGWGRGDASPVRCFGVIVDGALKRIAGLPFYQNGRIRRKAAENGKWECWLDPGR